MERLADHPDFDSKLISHNELRSEAREFLSLLLEAFSSSGTPDIMSEDYAPLRSVLVVLSESRAARGYPPSTTALFVLSLKNAFFARAEEWHKDDYEALARDTLVLSRLMDRLALFTIDHYTKSREQLISQQQREILEVSTPVIQVWDGVLLMPVIGTLDTYRTQKLMESLLDAIVDTASTIAILDISGVSVVDSMVANHLLRTVEAARMMGASCIISGIRPEIAQTIVRLEIDLSEVRTTSTMALALESAFSKLHLDVTAR